MDAKNEDNYLNIQLIAEGQYIYLTRLLYMLNSQ